MKAKKTFLIFCAAYFHLCTDDPIYKIAYNDNDDPTNPNLIVKDVSDPRTMEYLKDTGDYIQDILIDFGESNPEIEQDNPSKIAYTFYFYV